jgi:eukaryotic-like serine/threonine-protein kinase
MNNKPDPLDAILGGWESETGRAFDAVKVGEGVEFRVRDATQFAPADYKNGEARFVLTPVAGKDGEYTVEDKIRPSPPEGSKFDSAKSRNTCQEVWTAVQGQPLEASYDGTRLNVDFAKIAPTASNFTQTGKVVIGCTGLRNVPASRVNTVLTRTP